MTLSMHEASVGVFIPFLRNLASLLDKAEAHAAARDIDPAELLRMRLHPTMYDLSQQVAEAARHAVTASALLSRQDPPTFADTGSDLSALRRRIAAAIDFMADLPAAALESAADEEVLFRLRSGAGLTFTGRSMLLQFSVPQFFFHVATAYDILRHAGVELLKKDFLGRV